MSVVVVIPSRGRPEMAARAIRSIRDTAALVSTNVVLAVDRDDPYLPEYRALRWPGRYAAEASLVILDDEETGNLVRATNTISMRIARGDPNVIIGNVGDDQVARTRGWDRVVVETMVQPGFVYGNDLFQGEALPCGGVFIHSAISRALGWYALPTCEHLFIDNAWKEIGDRIGQLTYLPDMVFEHMHPLAGKGEWDEGYERANDQRVTDHDRIAFETWRDSGTGLARDVARVLESVEAASWAG